MTRVLRNPRSPGRCVFCGRSNLSKEHIWPRWSHALLPWGPNAQHREVRVTRTEKVKVVGEPWVLDRQGAVTTKKIRVVCRACNSGWMSEIEATVRSILTPLILGSPAALDQEAQRKLAEWITLKVMVGEQNIPEEAVIPQVDRDAFRASRAIPNCLMIWIAKCDAPHWRSAYLRNAAAFSLPHKMSAYKGGRNTQTTTFGIGNLLVFAVACTSEGLDMAEIIKPGVGIPRLWPAATSVLRWPPIWTVHLAGANTLANALDTISNSPGVLWKPLPSEVKS